MKNDSITAENIMNEVYERGLEATHTFKILVNVGGKKVVATASNFGVYGSAYIYDISAAQHDTHFMLRAYDAFLKGTKGKGVKLPVISETNGEYVDHYLILPDHTLIAFWILNSAELDNKDLLSVTSALVKAKKILPQ